MNYQDYPEKVQFVLWQAGERHKDKIVPYFEMCESPIEQMLFTTIAHQSRENVMKFNANHKVIFGLMPQEEVNPYRVDIGLTVLVDDKDVLHIAVECDGHDFHEKTKEQAAKDKARDRELTKQGYIVIRFTGSEIYKDPWKCADQIFDIVCSRSKELGFID